MIKVVYNPALSAIYGLDGGRQEHMLRSHFEYPNPKYDIDAATMCSAEGQDYIEQENNTFLFEGEAFEVPHIPTGLFWALQKWGSETGVQVDFVDFPAWFYAALPVDGIDPEIIKGITLRDYQIKACNRALLNRRGVLEIATGGGKSEMCIALTLHLNRKTLCVTPDQAAMKNLYDRFAARELRGMSVGRLGAGFKEYDADILVAVVNSLNSGLKRQNEDTVDFIRTAEVLFSDEAHHQKAASWIRVASTCNASYRYFLSGTPYKDDSIRDDPGLIHEEDSWLVGLSGRSLYYLPPKKLIKAGVLSVGMFVSFPVGGRLSPKMRWWPKVYEKGIVENLDRNSRICTLVSNLVTLDRFPLISIEKLVHGRDLQQRLWEEHQVPTACSFGSGVTYVPRKVAEAVGIVNFDGGREECEEFVKVDPDEVNAVRWLQEGKVRALIGSRIFDEAQNIVFLTDLINASGGKASQRLRQKIGRILRRAKGKNIAWFWDPWDTSHPYLLAHSRARKKIAQDEGYPVIDDPLFSLSMCEGNLSDLKIGDVTVKETHIEVSISLTIPLSGQSGGNFYIKPAVNLRARLEEGDDAEKCAEILHWKALSMFVRESYRQAAVAGAIGQHGFEKTKDHFVGQAQTYLEEAQ